MSSTGLGPTEAEICEADKLIERAMRPAGLYDAEERWVRAIIAANLKRQQRARGKKSKGAAKVKTEYRRNWVNLLLRYIVSKRYLKKPTSNETIMKIVGCLDDIGIEASEPQVRRDIGAVLKPSPLPTR